MESSSGFKSPGNTEYDDCWNDIAEFLTPKALKEEASSSNQSLNAVSYQSLENVSMEIPDVSWDALAEEMLNYSYFQNLNTAELITSVPLNASSVQNVSANLNTSSSLVNNCFPSSSSLDRSSQFWSLRAIDTQHRNERVDFSTASTSNNFYISSKSNKENIPEKDMNYKAYESYSVKNPDESKPPIFIEVFNDCVKRQPLKNLQIVVNEQMNIVRDSEPQYVDIATSPIICIQSGLKVGESQIDYEALIDNKPNMLKKDKHIFKVPSIPEYITPEKVKDKSSNVVKSGNRTDKLVDRIQHKMKEKVAERLLKEELEKKSRIAKSASKIKVKSNNLPSLRKSLSTSTTMSKKILFNFVCNKCSKGYVYQSRYDDHVAKCNKDSEKNESKIKVSSQEEAEVDIEMKSQEETSISESKEGDKAALICQTCDKQYFLQRFYNKHIVVCRKINEFEDVEDVKVKNDEGGVSKNEKVEGMQIGEESEEMKVNQQEQVKVVANKMENVEVENTKEKSENAKSDENLVCGKCDKSYKLKRFLDKHTLNCQGNSVEVEETSSQKEADVKIVSSSKKKAKKNASQTHDQLFCDTCNKSYVNKPQTKRFFDKHVGSCKGEKIESTPFSQVSELKSVFNHYRMDFESVRKSLTFDSC